MPLKNKPTDVIVVSSGLAGNRMGWGGGGVATEPLGHPKDNNISTEILN